jgi:hypothetical protein
MKMFGKTTPSIDDSRKQEWTNFILGAKFCLSLQTTPEHVWGFSSFSLYGSYKMASKRRLEDEQITQELYLHSDSDETLTSGDSNQTDSDTEVNRQYHLPLIYDKLN